MLASTSFEPSFRCYYDGHFKNLPVHHSFILVELSQFGSNVYDDSGSTLALVGTH